MPRKKKEYKSTVEICNCKKCLHREKIKIEMEILNKYYDYVQKTYPQDSINLWSEFVNLTCPREKRQSL